MSSRGSCHFGPSLGTRHWKRSKVGAFCADQFTASSLKQGSTTKSCVRANRPLTHCLQFPERLCWHRFHSTTLCLPATKINRKATATNLDPNSYELHPVSVLSHYLAFRPTGYMLFFVFGSNYAVRPFLRSSKNLFVCFSAGQDARRHPS